jgi:hypothetical protein
MVRMVTLAALGATSLVTADNGRAAERKSPMLLVAKDAELPLSKADLFALDVEPDKTSRPAAKESEPPLSKEDLFGLGADEKKDRLATPPTATDADVPGSKDALFGIEPKSDAKSIVLPGADVERPVLVKASTAKSEFDKPSNLGGRLWTELANNYQAPEHWSKVMGRLELASRGDFGQGAKWKASARLNYNAVYDLTDYYPNNVRHDQRAELQIREAYLDFAAGEVEWRVGRQDIVWGEMVGLFFADVVSAKDMREFVLPDFQVLRIPQWAARAEYFNHDFHAEVAWIPFPSYDNIGKPGSDYYSYPVSPAGIPVVQKERHPDNSLGHGNFGVRLSQLSNGWDISGFYYSSMDSSATFVRDAVVQNQFTPLHKRIWQAGGTMAKDFGDFVLKGEAVYTQGRRFNLTNLASSDGLVKQNTLDWALGLDMNPTSETRFNTQVFQRIYFNQNPDTIFDRLENGFSLLLNHKLARDWEAEILWIRSINRDDWMLRPKLSWRFQTDTRLNMGVDVFQGPDDGLFGQYRKRGDRVYAELRHDF